MTLPFKQPVPPRRAIALAAMLAGALAILWGGWEVYVRSSGRPASSGSVKAQIWSFLKKETGEKNFRVDLNLDGITSRTVTVNITNRSGKVRQVSRPARLNRMGLPDTSVSAYFRTNHATAPTYQRMYRLIGEQLWLADQSLENADPGRQAAGVVMAAEASQHARADAMNTWLSARICEAYLWPNLSLTENTNAGSLSADALLNLCEMAFQQADETNNLIRNFEYRIARADNPKEADRTRLRLASLLEKVGEHEKALACLKEITTIDPPRVQRQIAAIEARLKRQR